ncbi:MAG: D-arabitol-phosphate dehydrogenase [Phycisphaerae bacterium]|nr:D-arabitol-phosphate dehydrogenase [Phycisphaerae bacterium]
MKAVIYQSSGWRWLVSKLLGGVYPPIYWSELSGLRYRDCPIPELPGEQWVRVRTRLGGICGTDLALILQRNHPASYLQGMVSQPMVLGHENVAEIESVGSAVTGWQVGQRVCVEPAISCRVRGIDPPCRSCAAGRYALCEHVLGQKEQREQDSNAARTEARGLLPHHTLPRGAMIGYNRFTGGSWSSHFVAHVSQLHTVPESFTDEQAVLTDPLACALHAVLRAVPSNEASVIVVGGGILAMGVVAAIRALGSKATILALVHRSEQIEHLRRCGADDVVRFSRRDSRRYRFEVIRKRCGGQLLSGRFGNVGLLGGVDQVFDCIGSAESMRDALNYTRAGGTLLLVGTSSIALLDTTPLWQKEIRVLGCNGRQVEEYDGRAIHSYELFYELVQQGRWPLEGWKINTYPLTDFRQALNDLLRRRDGLIKVAFDFRKPS